MKSEFLNDHSVVKVKSILNKKIYLEKYAVVKHCFKSFFARHFFFGCKNRPFLIPAHNVMRRLLCFGVSLHRFKCFKKV